MPVDGEGPVAIMAGSGELPILLADRLRASRRAYRVLAFRGFCDRSLRRRADAVVDLLDFAGVQQRLASWKPTAVTLAGGLKRPSAAALLGALSAFRERDEIAAVAFRGDDNLLRGAVALLESRGFTLVGVRDLAPDLLAAAKVYGSVSPSGTDRASIGLGLRLLADLSQYDIGQAAVVAGERVLALEGPEGTDRALARAGSCRGSWLLGRRERGGVLIKAPKRGQDLRVDLPAIGPRTVVNAHRAGLSGIAVAAGFTLILDVARTTAAADRLGLFLAGVEPFEAGVGP